MTIDRNLLSEQAWTGTFFPPGRRDLSFGGELTYLPTDGVRLAYAMPMDLDFGGPYDQLYGILTDAIPCTLVGKFDKNNSSCADNHAGLFNMSKGSPFRYVLFGAHLASNETYDAFTFNIAGVQDFFSPRPERTPYQKMPVLNVPIEGGTLEVCHSASGMGLSKNLRESLILFDGMPDSQNAMAEFQEAYDAIRKSYPNFQPVVKSSLEFYFSFTPTDKMEIPEAFHVCQNVANLFALLFLSPAKINRFEAIARDQNKTAVPLPVFPSALSELSSIERSLTPRSFHQLPINCSDLDLATLIQNWMANADNYTSITSWIQGQNQTVSLHDMYSSIVLSVAQLEIMDGVKNSKKKYQVALAGHSSQEARDRLCSLLGCTPEKLGKLIADLRNEIVHLGNRPEILPKLSARKLNNISHLLQAIVTSYALGKVGLPKASQEKYQNYWATI